MKNNNNMSRIIELIEHIAIDNTMFSKPRIL